MAGHVVMNAIAVNEMMTSEAGLVAKDLQRRLMAGHAAAVRACPVNTGNLRSSLRWNISRDSKGLVGALGTDVEYASYVINGTRPHEILPVNGQALYWPGALHPVASVQHPGTRPNPFMDEAMRVMATT